jgi:hypothetical protein
VVDENVVPTRLLILVVAGVLVFGALVYLRIQVGHSAPPVPASVINSARPASSPSAADPWSEISPDPDHPTRTPPRRPMVTPRSSTEGERAVPPPIKADAAESPPSTPTLESDPDLSMSNAMDETNRLFDRGDYEGAQQSAQRVLDKLPGNVRMLRIMVSTSCFMGENDKAQKYWVELSERDRVQMQTRCARYGVEFKEP